MEIGHRLFQYRDYTPIPLIVLMWFAAEPTVLSATVGTLITVFGELFRIYSVAFIGTVSRTRSNSTGANLITEGPFAFVRNPLYIGNFIICFGIAVFSCTGWLVVLTVGLFAFQYYCIVKYEETILVEKFGEEYETYLRTVPAWLPKHLPSLDSIQWPTNFAPSLRSESRTLLAIALMLFSLILLSHR